MTMSETTSQMQSNTFLRKSFLRICIITLVYAIES